MTRFQGLDESVLPEIIHPGELFLHELLLAEKFVRDSVKEASATIAGGTCPYSDSSECEALFEKWGYQYSLCTSSWSVFLSNPPSNRIIDNYFSHSELADYRAGNKYQSEVTATRASLWANQITWIESRILRYLSKQSVTATDWGSRATGWVQQLSRASVIQSLQVVEPLVPVESSDADAPTEIVLLFDVLQRSLAPLELLERARERLIPGGLLLLTCRAGSGFDILSLGEASHTVYPFDHLSLPSPEALTEAAQNLGLEVLEVTTPGALDVELVHSAGASVPKTQRFQRYLCAKKPKGALVEFQEFLQSSNSSSHLRAVLRRPL